MSILSNHFPEILDFLNGLDGDADSRDHLCECPPDGGSLAEMCPRCQAEYAAYLALVDSQEASGQQFADGPLPEDVPF